MPDDGTAVIGGLSLSAHRPRLAGSVWTAATAQQLTAWRADGLAIAEIRLDLSAATDAPAARQLCDSFADIPTILTLRAEWEGGACRLDEAARGRLLQSVMPYCDAVDIELAADDIVADSIVHAKSLGKTVILSHHQFSAAATEPSLKAAMQRALMLGADIFKTASICLSDEDFQILADFARFCRIDNKLCIIIGMDDGSDNPHAKRARVELPRLGSCLAFAALDEQSAPGQLSLKEMATALTT